MGTLWKVISGIACAICFLLFAALVVQHVLVITTAAIAVAGVLYFGSQFTD